MKRVTSVGAQKTGHYPFVSDNISPDGKPTLVKSHRHRKELMKRYGMNDDKISVQTMNKRRRWHVEEKEKEKKTVLKETFLKARGGRIDLRPQAEAIRKHNYLVKNGYVKGG